MKILFGVPTLTRYDLLGRLLASVEAGTVRPESYYLIDNGDLAAQKVEEGSLVLPANMSIDRPGMNLGVAASWNKILRRAEVLGLTAIISGDDIVVRPDTLERLVNAAEASTGLFFYANGASSWAFFLQKPELAEKIGYYDENFWPAYFEDNDYHRRMLLAGENYAMITDAIVDHDISSTLRGFGDNSPQKKWLEKEFDKNSRYYGIKWGGPPGQERLGAPNLDAAQHRGGRENP